MSYAIRCFRSFPQKRMSDVRLCTCCQERMEVFKKAFRGKQATLVEEIVIEPLWTQLKTFEVLTDRQIRDCQSCVRNH